ncbi:MAG: tetratricopeptide repeat protein [Cyclonatronaceae bacterium]
MDLLKTISILPVLLLAVSMAVTVPVQGQDALVEAFRVSYELEHQGNYTNAAVRLQQVYQRDSYEINLRLGWLYYRAGAFDESEAYYSNAVALKPYAVEPRFGLALPLAAAGKSDELIVLYGRILETDPQNSIANYRLGLIYYNRGEYEKADSYIEKVVNLYPFDYDSLILFGWNKLALQRNREARVLFQKVLLYSPGDESALQGLEMLK